MDNRLSWIHLNLAGFHLELLLSFTDQMCPCHNVIIYYPLLSQAMYTGDSNQRPLDLLPNALPQSYPITECHDEDMSLMLCGTNRQNTADQPQVFSDSTHHLTFTWSYVHVCSLDHNSAQPPTSHVCNNCGCLAYPFGFMEGLQGD